MAHENHLIDGHIWPRIYCTFWQTVEIFAARHPHASNHRSWLPLKRP